MLAFPSIPEVSQRTIDVWFGLHLTGGTLESRRAFTEKWLAERDCPPDEVKALLDFMDPRVTMARHAPERLGEVYAQVAAEMDPGVRTRLMQAVLGL